MEIVFKIIGVLVWIAIIALPLALVGLVVFFIVRNVFFTGTQSGRNKKIY